LAFAALFTGFNISPEQGDYGAAVIMTLGVFIGSMIWWLILAGGISTVRHKLSTQALKHINQISGLFILGFGIFMFARLFW